MFVQCRQAPLVANIVHQKGGHQKGAGAFGVRPFLVESVVVDGEKYGVIYGAIYPTSYGTNYMSVQITFVQVWAAPKGVSQLLPQASGSRPQS